MEGALGDPQDPTLDPLRVPLCPLEPLVQVEMEVEILFKTPKCFN